MLTYKIQNLIQMKKKKKERKRKEQKLYLNSGFHFIELFYMVVENYYYYIG